MSHKIQTSFKRNKEDPEKVKKRNRIYYLNNKDKMLSKATKWQQLNKEKHYKTVKSWQERNSDKFKDINRSWQSKHPEKIKEYRKRNNMKRLGITQESYDTLFKDQHGRCKLCYKHQSELKRALAVDHDHSCCSGKKSCGKCIRGLLCQTCNLLLGLAKDSKSLLKRAAIYVST